MMQQVWGSLQWQLIFLDQVDLRWQRKGRLGYPVAFEV
jgi:hypothetical protein